MSPKPYLGTESNRTPVTVTIGGGITLSGPTRVGVLEFQILKYSNQGAGLWAHSGFSACSLEILPVSLLLLIQIKLKYTTVMLMLR
jgi:hypothetical protein